MMWAACCLIFLDFYAAASLQCHHKVPTTAKSTFHLRTYVAVDNQANPQPLRVVIKQSKTDPFRQGASLYLGKADSFICPVTGILPIPSSKRESRWPSIYSQGWTRQFFSTFLDDS